jgi:hypothetical protein
MEIMEQAYPLLWKTRLEDEEDNTNFPEAAAAKLFRLQTNARGTHQHPKLLLLTTQKYARSPTATLCSLRYPSLINRRNKRLYSAN